MTLCIFFGPASGRLKGGLSQKVSNNWKGKRRAPEETPAQRMDSIVAVRSLLVSGLLMTAQMLFDRTSSSETYAPVYKATGISERRHKKSGQAPHPAYQTTRDQRVSGRVGRDYRRIPRGKRRAAVPICRILGVLGIGLNMNHGRVHLTLQDDYSKFEGDYDRAKRHKVGDKYKGAHKTVNYIDDASDIKPAK
jgi:hypothetical protein